MATYCHSFQHQVCSDSLGFSQNTRPRPSSGHMYPVSSVKECNQKDGKCKISRVLQSPVLHIEKFKMETPESIRTSLIPGEWVSSIRRLASHPHPPKLKEIPKVLPQVFQFTSFPFRLATAPPPQVFTMIVKEVKLMALSRGLRLHQYLDDWLFRSQSQEKSQVNTQAVVDLTQFFGWIINQDNQN